MTVGTVPTGSGVASIYEEIAAGRVTAIGLNVDQYHALIASHLLGDDPTSELIEGVIVRKDRSAAGENPMTVGDRHRLCLQRLMRLGPQFDGHGCYLQLQQPVTLPPNDEPEPGAAVIRGSEDDHADGPPRPGDVLCAIEVADSSLRRDRTVKLRRYALAGIPVYVIVNLVDDRVEVYAKPANGTYPPPLDLRAGSVLRLPAADGTTVDVPVERLLP